MNTAQQKQMPLIAWILIACAIILVGLQFVSGITLFLTSATIKVEHPLDSSFPELDKVLQDSVKDGRVDYLKLKKSPLLEEAIKKLARFSPDQIKDHNDRLCFWINAYNLLILKEIADRYPILSVKQLGNDPDRKIVFVGGTPSSIQTIYLSQIIPLLKSGTPEASFLVCGGARGHPDLLDHSITPSNLQKQCEDAAERFIAKKENVSVDVEKHAFHLSPWFEWQSAWIAPKYGSVEKFIDLYLTPELRNVYDIDTTQKVFNKSFDWRVNSQKGSR